MTFTEEILGSFETDVPTLILLKPQYQLYLLMSVSVMYKSKLHAIELLILLLGILKILNVINE